MSLREEIRSYLKTEYNTESERPWRTSPNNEVFRHSDNQKWYAIIMDVKKDALGIPGDGYVDVINVKLDPMMVDLLRGQNGYLPAYHMNKKSWLSILLDGSVNKETVLDFIDESYTITASKKNRKKSLMSGPRDWLIPANPKYYDVVGAFEQSNIIDWKQSSDVHIGDTVYLYVAAPYSAIMYKCKVLEVIIPYPYEHRLNIKRLMKIQLLNQYAPDFMTFERMKNEFGVYAVRGPRNVPNSLLFELNMYEKS